MNRVTDALMFLKEAAECVKGKVISIELDENAYDEIDSCFQYTAPPPINNLGTSTMKKFMGIEIKKGK